MIFTSSRSLVTLNYAINGLTLLSLDTSVNDLGFVFDLTLSPNLHVEEAWCKSLKTLDFVKRVSAKFNLVFQLKLFLLLAC